MKKLIFLLILVIINVAATIAQQSTPAPTPNPPLTDQPANSAANIKQQAENARNAQIEEERRMRVMSANKGAVRMDYPAGKVPPCSQCPKGGGNLKISKETEELISPNKEDLAKYKQFLKQKNTGLVRLMTDKGCGENARIIKTDEYCVSLTEIPGFGSSFSFRTNKYVLGRFADVVYRDKKLYLFGNLTLGFMFKAGSNVVENISPTTKGMSVLYNYEPPVTLKELESENKILMTGLTISEIEYKKSFNLEVGQTFGLRSIAFQLKKEWIENGWNRYDISNYDERKDVIIAVQVIRIEDHSVTLLWKELQRKDSPKIELSKEEAKEITGSDK